MAELQDPWPDKPDGMYILWCEGCLASVIWHEKAIEGFEAGEWEEFMNWVIPQAHDMTLHDGVRRSDEM